MEKVPLYVVDLPLDKATRRVIAPFLKVIRKKHFSIEYDRKDHSVEERQPEDVSIFQEDLQEISKLLYDSSQIMKIATNADGVCLYMVDACQNEIYLNQQNEEINQRNKVNWDIEEGSTISAYVAKLKTFVMIDDAWGHESFPLGIGYQDESIKSVLCLPILTPLEECVAVIELYREPSQPSFNERDLELSLMVTGWIGSAIHHNRHKLQLMQQQNSDEFLMELVRSYFSSKNSLDKVIAEIMKFAKRSLNAMRTTFFVIDQDSKTLIADVFEEGIEDVEIFHKLNVKVRLGMEPSFAGIVARTKTTLNIKDALNDPRFPKQIDIKTGLITRSVLCIPIISGNNVLGIAQFVNKINDLCFTLDDINLFNKFSEYIVLILQYSQLNRRVKKTKLSLDATTELLDRQIPPCSHNIESFHDKLAYVNVPEDFDQFYWYISPTDETNYPVYTLYMIKQICGSDELDVNVAIEFILAVMKFYRNIPYHNFGHAFNVTHCMYNILQRNMNVFTSMELKCLIIATLCHDIDHFGLTNNFLQVTNHILAQIDNKSPLEAHHFDVAQHLLKKYKIFSKMTDEEYSTFISNLRQLITATDLMNYFNIRNKIIQIGISNLNWEDDKHRALIKGILMVSCDLSGVCKPYSISKRLVKKLYEEFYNQGDLEKKLGLTPLPLMDREKSFTVPEDQVHFMSFVVIPVTTLLQALLPNTSELHNQAVMLKKSWEDILNMQNVKNWKRDDSVHISSNV